MKALEEKTGPSFKFLSLTITGESDMYHLMCVIEPLFVADFMHTKSI